MKFYPNEKGGQKSFSHAEGGGTKSFHSLKGGREKFYPFLREGRKKFRTRDFPIYFFIFFFINPTISHTVQVLPIVYRHNFMIMIYIYIIKIKYVTIYSTHQFNTTIFNIISPFIFLQF